MFERRTTFEWISPGLLVVGFLTFCVPGPASAQSDQVLANADVVAMSKADLGDDVITAKIHQAPSEKLDVSTDALIALKKSGVTKVVIGAMVKRVEQRAGAKGQTASNAAGGAGEPSNPNRPVSVNVNGASVFIEPLAGVQRFVDAYFSKKIFFDFPGSTSTTKLPEGRVTVFVRSDLNPSAQYWIVKPKVLKGETRCLKIGSMKGAVAPDEDWTVPATVEKSSERVTIGSGLKNKG
jgi:hypothetical protein